MVENSRVVMLGLDVVALVTTLALFRVRGVRWRGLAITGALALGWLLLMHALARDSLVPEQLSTPAFLGLVVLGVAVAGGLLWFAKGAVALLTDADLLRLQGVRLLFGATFFIQALVGALPRQFGLIDGVTHMLAGALGLWAARSSLRGAAWLANLFGIVDIVVVLSTLSVVLLPEITARHPMMYAVFGPAPFWAWWHVLSLGRLLRVKLPLAPVTMVALGLALSLTSCKPFILRTVMTTVDPYFHGAEVDRVELTQVAPHTFSFQWNWYRNLVVLTSEGLVVIDPMGAKAAAALKNVLSARFPGVAVRRLIYSHYHLDHVRGGAVLAPAEVIAHEKCERYWAAIDHGGVLAPTRTISGDTDLSIGGVTIRALDLGLSHTDTLFAFYLPEERVLFTADLGLVKAVAPAGVPDRYAPGYVAALDRLAALDFDVFVPSHFGVGRKQDLIDWRDMLEYGRTLARQAIARSGSFGLQGQQLGAYFDDIYYPMRERYGTWHGFDEMIILNIVRDIEGEGLGH